MRVWSVHTQTNMHIYLWYKPGALQPAVLVLVAEGLLGPPLERVDLDLAELGAHRVRVRPVELTVEATVLDARV